ncbi:MAG: hypothetical protein ACPHEP_04410 [Acidimicrobiales bacterium]
MSCCDGTVDDQTLAFSTDFQDLPTEAFCCMARLAYAMYREAEKEYRDNDTQEWWDFSIAERHELAESMRAYLLETKEPELELHRLMYGFLLKLTIAL